MLNDSVQQHPLSRGYHGASEYKAMGPTLGLKLRPQVDRLMPWLVGVREVAGVP